MSVGLCERRKMTRLDQNSIGILLYPKDIMGEPKVTHKHYLRKISLSLKYTSNVSNTRTTTVKILIQSVSQQQKGLIKFYLRSVTTIVVHFQCMFPFPSYISTQ